MTVTLEGMNPWVLEKEEVSDCRTSIPQTFLRFVGLIQDIIFRIGKFFYQLVHPRSFSDDVEEAGEGKSKALVVLLHGLHSNPGHMRICRRSLERKHGDQLAFFQPQIHKKGNCSLDDAAEKVHQSVLKWAEDNPGKEIIFSGVSNGARISGHVASELKITDKISNPIKVHAIAGPFFGSKMVNQPNWPKTLRGAWRWLLKTPIMLSHSKEILDELSWGSERSVRLLSRMKLGACEGVDFSFYATYGDVMVSSTTSAFPRGIEGASYHMLKYHGHSSILRGVNRKIVSTINFDA